MDSSEADWADETSEAFWEFASMHLFKAESDRKPRPIILCEAAGGQSNRMLAVVSTVLLALVAGAELRLGQRALDDFGPGSAYQPPRRLLDKLACDGACAAAAAFTTTSLPVLSLKSTRELDALFLLKDWDPLGPPLPPLRRKKIEYTPKAVAETRYETVAAQSAASVAALAGYCLPLLALHPAASKGLVVSTNQWFVPILFDKKFVVGARRTSNGTSLQTTCLVDIFESLPGFVGLDGRRRDPFDVVSSLLYRPAPAVSAAAAAARKVLLPRPLLTVHFRSTILFENLRGATANGRDSPPTPQGREAEERRRFDLAARCVSQRAVQLARRVSGPAQVFISGDHDQIVASVAKIVRSDLARVSSICPTSNVSVVASFADLGSYREALKKNLTQSLPLVESKQTIISSQPTKDSQGRKPRSSLDSSTALLDSLLLAGSECLSTPRSTFSDVAAARRRSRAPAFVGGTSGCQQRRNILTCLPIHGWRILGHLACLAAPLPKDEGPSALTGRDKWWASLHPACPCSDPSSTGFHVAQQAHGRLIQTQLRGAGLVGGACPIPLRCAQYKATGGAFDRAPLGHGLPVECSSMPP